MHECAAVDVNNPQIGTFSNVILRLTEELGKTIELPEYVVQVQKSELADGVEQDQKRQTQGNVRVSVEPKGPEPFLSGDAKDCLWLFEDVQEYKADDFKLGWHLRAAVSDDSDICQLKVIGLSVFPARNMKLTPDTMLSLAIVKEGTDQANKGQ